MPPLPRLLFPAAAAGGRAVTGKMDVSRMALASPSDDDESDAPAAQVPAPGAAPARAASPPPPSSVCGGGSRTSVASLCS
eukprot:CAMPEP_0173428118 /NCGR_PEP_ID=MMETSP1357-20121228/7140_1 /TAXON_ID=77926 /ORGANISM="Hemiselmis rufescens, Strain PCC563" /LENGTH=79 /DNA_ID=CAMNT_0014392081 /DNA_START=39 /DNA_END=274 /DNA_ORIENTATION=+